VTSSWKEDVKEDVKEDELFDPNVSKLLPLTLSKGSPGVTKFKIISTETRKRKKRKTIRRIPCDNEDEKHTQET